MRTRDCLHRAAQTALVARTARTGLARTGLARGSGVLAKLVAVMCMSAATSFTLRAQDATATATATATASASPSVSTAPVLRNAASDDYNPGAWHLDQCLGGLTYGAPFKLAVSWAGGFRKELASGQDVCAFVSPKIGLGGTRLSVGFAHTLGTFGSGVAVSGGVLRTFGAPSYADRMSTYAGGSVHVFPILGIGLEIGSYHRIGGIAGQGRKSIIIWSAGIGF